MTTVDYSEHNCLGTKAEEREKENRTHLMRNLRNSIRSRFGAKRFREKCCFYLFKFKRNQNLFLIWIPCSKQHATKGGLVIKGREKGKKRERERERERERQGSELRLCRAPLYCFEWQYPKGDKSATEHEKRQLSRCKIAIWVDEWCFLIGREDGRS